MEGLLGVTYETLAEVCTPSSRIQLRFHPRSTVPELATVSHDSHTLGFLMGRPPDAAARQHGNVRQDFETFGTIVFHPRDVAWDFIRCQGPWTSIVCEFTDDEIFDTIVGKGKDWERYPLDACINIRSPEIAQLFRLLECELRAPSFSSVAVSETLMIGGLQYLARYLDFPHRRNERGTYALTRPQMNAIDERIGDTSQGVPTVDEIAMICGVSKRHVLRKFKQSKGLTVSGYIAHFRLMKAKDLLCRTDLSVKVIAFQLGFSSVGNFCNAFRNATNERPEEFRQHMR